MLLKVRVFFYVYFEALFSLSVVCVFVKNCFLWSSRLEVLIFHCEIS